jgi:hypothetical protein
MLACMKEELLKPESSIYQIGQILLFRLHVRTEEYHKYRVSCRWSSYWLLYTLGRERVNPPRYVTAGHRLLLLLRRGGRN